MAIIKTNALVVRRLDYSETSQIATLFCPDAGRVDCIAKGSRARWLKPHLRAKIECPLDTLTLNRVVYYEKRGEALYILSESEVIHTFVEARAELGHWHAAVAVQELALQGIQPGVPNPALFYAAVRAMVELARGADWRLALLDYFARWLVAEGREPDLSVCAKTGRDLAEATPVHVGLRDGVAFTKSSAPATLPGGAVEFELDHVLVLRKFLHGVEKPLTEVWLPDWVLLPIVNLLQGLLVEALERYPLSFRLLRWQERGTRAATTPQHVGTRHAGAAGS